MNNITLFFLLIFATLASAAPKAIEGYIDSVQILTGIDQKYVFANKPVKLIYLVGHMYGKDYKWYKYMVVKDSTELEGVSYDGLKKGVYVRLRSRAEPPGMVGQPLDSIRKSRYGACEYALLIDTVFTPRNLSGIITRTEAFGSTDLVVTVKENSVNAREFKYLIVNGKTTISNGTFSDIKALKRVEISNASINVPGPVTMYCSILHTAQLFAFNLAFRNDPIITEIPSEGLKIWFRADQGVLHSENKVTQWSDQSGNNLHAMKFKGQPILVPSAVGGKPAIYFNGKGDVLEFKGWSPDGLDKMTIAIVSSNSEYQPEPTLGGGEEGGRYSSQQSILSWEQRSDWGMVLLSAYQNSVSLRFGTGQSDNINNWKRSRSIGNAPTLTTAIHNGTTDKLYVDGSLIKTYTGKLSTIKGCASNGYIGRWAYGGDKNGWFAGNVAEIIVYDRALSDSDVSELHLYLQKKYLSQIPVSVINREGLGRNLNHIERSNSFDLNGRLINE